ncbi:MAG: hypothetical protein WC401_10720 [Bacteroidales bacterium]
MKRLRRKEMINNFAGMISLECDICGEEADECFDDFYEAVEWKKDKTNGWRSNKDKDGNWQDICPNCVENKRYK